MVRPRSGRRPPGWRLVTRQIRIVGPGRAGGSFARALERVGWDVVDMFGRDDDARGAAAEVDLVLITTPDEVIDVVAQIIEPGDAVVAHAAGSLGLDVLAPHMRRAAIHPLISLPTPEIGAQRLVANGWFGVAGDAIVDDVVQSFGGRSFVVADDDRPTYHAAACVAANHLVALMGQVERLAGAVDVPAEAFHELSQGSLDSVRALGAAAALTGPAARGDDETIERHLAALAPDERGIYEVMVGEARRLAGRGVAPHDGDA